MSAASASTNIKERNDAVLRQLKQANVWGKFKVKPKTYTPTSLTGKRYVSLTW
jgi:hypothetical protein